MTDLLWFDDLYRASRDRLLMIALAFTRDVEEAQDVVQEAFVRGWADRDKLGRADNAEAWLCTVALNVARRRGRRRSMARMLTGRSATIDHNDDLDTAALVDLRRAIDALPRDQRAVVFLHHLADLPLTDIATLLSVPIGTVKSRLARGRTQLKLDLDQTDTLVAFPEERPR